MIECCPCGLVQLASVAGFQAGQTLMFALSQITPQFTHHLLHSAFEQVASDGSSEDESGSGSDDADWSPDLPRKRLRL